MNINAICFAMAAAALMLQPLDTCGATVSTPYVNTFDTMASTNDFAYGGSPADKLLYVEWTWNASMHQNYMRSANAAKTLYGWATLDFSDVGGTPALARNFAASATMRAKSNVGTTLTRPGGFQGLCALASNEALGEYYYAMVYFTNVVGYVSISKIVAGSEVLSVSSPTTITFDRDWVYNLRLVGDYSSSASPKLTLSFDFSRGAETNSVSLVDPDPLAGTRIGYRSCNNNGGCWVWWDNFAVESWVVPDAGTVVVIR